MDPVADANQFIVAYAEGAIALGGGFAWNVPGQPLSGGGAVPDGAADDVSFFAQVMPLLARRYSIDARRIFVQSSLVTHQPLGKWHLHAPSSELIGGPPLHVTPAAPSTSPTMRPRSFRAHSAPESRRGLKRDDRGLNVGGAE